MALTASEVEIKVTPDMLYSKAQEVSGMITQMEQLIDDVQTTVTKTKHYWIGEAGDLHRQMFEEQKDDMAQVMTRLKDHPVNLQQIAGNYIEVETVLEETFGQLSSDLLD